jgi:hypothetical protein
MDRVDLGLALFGFAASIAVWAMAVWSVGRAARTAIAAAPSSWQSRFKDDYEAAGLTLRLRGFLLAAEALWALALWMAAFLVLNMFDVILVVQLGAAVVYAVWATAGERRRRRAEVATLVRDGLEPVPPNPGLSWWFSSSLLSAWVGFLSAACFLAVVIVELAGG